MIEKGTSLYSVVIDWYGETPLTELQELVVTTIKKKRGVRTVFLVKKNSATWVKLSSKNFHYGWANNIDSVFRKNFPFEEGIPDNMAKTPGGAYTKAVQIANKRMKLLNKYASYARKLAGDDVEKTLAVGDRLYVVGFSMNIGLLYEKWVVDEFKPASNPRYMMARRVEFKKLRQTTEGMVIKDATWGPTTAKIKMASSLHDDWEMFHTEAGAHQACICKIEEDINIVKKILQSCKSQQSRRKQKRRTKK